MNYKNLSLVVLAASLALPAFAAGKTHKTPATGTATDAAAKQPKHKKMHKGADKMAPAGTTTPAPVKP